MTTNNISEFLTTTAARTWDDQQTERRKLWGRIDPRDGHYYSRFGTPTEGQRKAQDHARAWVRRQVDLALEAKGVPTTEVRDYRQELDIMLRSDYRVQAKVSWGYRQHQRKIVLEKNSTGLDFDAVADAMIHARKIKADQEEREAQGRRDRAAAMDALEQAAEGTDIQVTYQSGGATFDLANGRQVHARIQGDNPERLKLELTGLDAQTLRAILTHVRAM